MDIITRRFSYLCLFSLLTHTTCAMQKSQAMPSLSLEDVQSPRPTATVSMPTPLSEAERARLGNELLAAARVEHAYLVHQYIKKGADVGVKDHKGRTALMCVFRSDLTQNCCAFIVKELLKAGADANAVDTNGLTALVYALQRAGDFSAYKSNMFYIDQSKISEIDVILKTLYNAVLMLLFRMTTTSINKRSKSGYTALEFAALITDPSFVQALLNKRAEMSEHAERLAAELKLERTLRILRKAREGESESDESDSSKI